MATYKNVTGGNYVITVDGGAGNVDINGGLDANLITANFYLGDGRFLSNVTANIGAASILQNGTSNVAIPVTNGNITFGVNLNSNVIVVSTLGANITTGTVATSNVTGALIINGGLGVKGAIYADTIFANNSPVLDGNSVISGGTY